MESQEFWFRELLVMMGEDPDKFLAEQSEKGKEETKRFLDFVKRIQDDALAGNTQAVTENSVPV